MAPAAVRWLRAVLDVPAERVDAAAAFWAAVTGQLPGLPRGADAEVVALLPPAGDDYLWVQRVGPGGGGWHPDLLVADMAGSAEAAVLLGATLVERAPGLVVACSPGGQAFCLVAHEGQSSRPPPAHWPRGHRSLVDQLCLDIPPSRHETECAFWERLTGWPRQTGNLGCFSYLSRPAAMPLRVLLQRLDDEQPHVSAHLDLACDDIGHECERHEVLGATVLRRTLWWTTLRDPAGLDYCITRRHPDTGTVSRP